MIFKFPFYLPLVFLGAGRVFAHGLVLRHCTVLRAPLQFILSAYVEVSDFCVFGIFPDRWDILRVTCDVTDCSRFPVLHHHNPFFFSTHLLYTAIFTVYIFTQVFVFLCVYCMCSLSYDSLDSLLVNLLVLEA